MGVRKIKDNLLHINNLRKFLGYEIFKAAIGSEFKLEISDTPKIAKVLVLSPHPDDDIIGCGGTLYLHSQQSDQIKIIYLTDGSGGLPKGSTCNRAEEAKNAAHTIGIDDLSFWKFKDGNLHSSKVTVELLKEVISNFNPTVIYVPSFLDPHPDHFQTAQILATSLKELPNEPAIWSYEVWSPIYANRIMNIDKSFRAKREALAAHASQISERGYLSAITGLAQYRAGMFNVGQYAEAFFACNKRLYLKLLELITLEK